MPLYLVDGNLGSRSVERLPPGTMAGVQGTLPGATVSEEFRSELDAADPGLTGVPYSYAPESYDAITLVALATQAAHTDGAPEIAAQMQAVSEGGQSCASFQECNDLLKQGEDVDYDGVSGAVDLNDWGEPTSGTVGLFTYDDLNQVPGYDTEPSEDHAPQYVDAKSADPAGEAPALAQSVDSSIDGQLVLGTLVPDTGSLATFASPINAAQELAVKQINDAGGVLGRKVMTVPGDAGDDVAQGSVDAQLQQGVDAIVSAASSDVTLNVLDQVVAAGVLMVGSAQTAPDLTNAEDGGLYFRTTPSDALQGQVLADRITDAGADSVALIVRDDPYGNGLADAVAQRLKDDGAQVVETAYYDVGQRRFSKQVKAVASSQPDAVALISFDEAGKIIKEMVAQGIGPNSS
jgi:ABC-type branched-subunit amino acid transport system substrate-binding protein